MIEFFTLVTAGAILFYPDQKAREKEKYQDGKNNENPIIKIGL